MKKVRKISKEYYLRQIMACWLVFSMLFLPVRVALAAGPDPGALPQGWEVVTGTVGGFDYSTTNELHIRNIANGTIIKWLEGFNIGSAALTEFQLINAGAAVMNRDVTGNMSEIYGSLTANGNVFIVNPAGIVFGCGATVNVNQLVASSLNILDEDFLNGAPYQFDAGVAVGDVKNYGEITATDGLVALMGRNVINEGTVTAKTVIMAAGDRVFISDDSPIVVEVEMDTLPENRTVYNNDDENLSNADHVILAAGDIWSAAITDVETFRAEAKGDVVLDGDIYAEAGPGSDAVADVTIITGGDLDIEDNITAVATGDGVGGFDAIAGVTIEAGGDIEIHSDGTHTTQIKAKAKDGVHNYADVIIEAGGNVQVEARNGDVKIIAEADPVDFESVLNVANIEITGDNVRIKSEDEGGIFDILSPDDALVKAYAHDGGENIANVSITANGEGDGPGNVLIESEGQKGDDVLVKAEAKNGEDNLATVGISAAGDVDVRAYGLFDEALVQAEAWNEIEPEIEYETVVVQEGILDEQKEITEEVANAAVQGLTNTATVDIAAGGNVSIYGSGSGDAAVKALAHNDIKVDIDNYDNEVTVNLTVADLENTAGVTIAAGGEGVSVEADGLSSRVGIASEAYNELEIEQNTGGYYWEKIEGRWTKVYRDSYAAALTLNVSGLDNKADIGITAENGNVEVGSDECLFGAESIIGASAWNEISDIDLSGESTGTLSLDGLTNAANIDVTAGYDIEVVAKDGGESGIAASASNKLDEYDGVDMTAENLSNDAGVTVDAVEGSVLVKAECQDDSSDAYITANAWNEMPSPDNEADSIVNTAGVGITAGEDVKVFAKDDGRAYIEAGAEYGTDNTSGVTIATKNGDVLVHAVDADASIEAWAEDGVDNIATIDIAAVGGDVKVIDIGHGGERSSYIEASTEDAENSNTSEITITATAVATTYEIQGDGDEVYEYTEVEGGNIEVIAKDGGHAEIKAKAATAGEEDDEDTSNTANVRLKAIGVEVAMPIQQQDVFQVTAEPQQIKQEYSNVMVGGNVEVRAEGGECGPESEASIKAVTVEGASNESDILICAEDVYVSADEGGEAEILSLAHVGQLNDAYVGINARGWLGVRAYDGGEASIGSLAFNGYSNTAYTIICAEDAEVYASSGGEAGITAGAYDGVLNTANLDLISRGDVDVMAKRGGEAVIEAEAEDGEEENNAHVGIWADDDVEVSASSGGEAGIAAEAANWDEDGTDNDAEVWVVAGGDILVEAARGGDATIEAEAAKGDNENSAYVGLWTDGDVVVTATRGGEAVVEATAKDGIDNNADVAVCAEGDVIVASGFNPDDVIEEGELNEDVLEGLGGTATIQAIAEADGEHGTGFVWNEDTKEFDEVRVETSADASVKIVSHDGGVAVVDITGEEGEAKTAMVLAEASGAYSNTADVGVAAGGDLMDGALTEDGTLYGLYNNISGFELNEELGLGVLVAGIGYNSKAGIFAYAHDGMENTADVVVCTPDIVAVVAYADEGCGSAPFAQIKSRAGAYGGEGDAVNTAKTQVYAGDVLSYVPTIAKGRGIWASAADTEGSPHVDSSFLMTEYDDAYGTGNFNWTIDNFDEVEPVGDDSATLIIDTYANRQDCPECDPRPLPPPCPTCEEGEEEGVLFAPVAPLAQFEIPRLEGCPQLVQAAAMELGITAETIQIGIGNALALNPTIQPCEACASLVNAASILRDEDGSRMAAMLQTFNALAPADAPFTPETAASIAMAFEGAAEGSQYASAMEYVDAFVDYVAALDTGLGSPVGDSVAFVMEKYGDGITGSDNANITAFVTARLAAIGG